MKQLLFLATIISIVCINWRMPETVSGNGKLPVNFYGELITQQGKKYNVNNISLYGKYKQITVYDLKERPQPKLNPETKKKEIILQENPIKHYVTSNIDLSEISEIQILHPDVTWIYQKKPNGRSLNFIEATIVSNDSKKTKNNYLLPRAKTEVQFDEILSKDHELEKKAPPLEKKAPFSAIKKLIIKGYSLRDVEDKQKNTRNSA